MIQVFLTVFFQHVSTLSLIASTRGAIITPSMRLRLPATRRSQPAQPLQARRCHNWPYSFPMFSPKFLLFMVVVQWFIQFILISAERDLGPKARYGRYGRYVPCCSLGRSLVPWFSTRSWLAGTPGAVEWSWQMQHVTEVYWSVICPKASQ